ncbi:MAG TPA: Uma2 family endonuclease [Pyrinomonadaceae bacterium]|nr:Uma2 family endonuclease [Pyrinomonadaceae bacterium]
MGLAEKVRYIGVEEYLEGEKLSQIRREFIDGQVFAMAGASKRHNQICGNLYRNLSSRLIGSDCDVFMESVKVRPNAITFYYPDIVVTCEPGDDDEYIVHQPVVIVEVISPTSERADRYEKLQIYRQIPSLREYVIVWQDEMLVEVHRRNERQEWTVERFSQAEAEIDFDSIDFALKLSEIYQAIEF